MSGWILKIILEKKILLRLSRSSLWKSVIHIRLEALHLAMEALQII